MERLLTLYSEVQSTDVRWLWYPFIAIGKITLLQGDPGDGKSTMMMNLIAELSTGGKTPDGCKIGAPQKVIYQCSEDGVSDTIKPRLERCGADCRKIAFINEEVYNGLTLDDERIRQAIIEFRPRLVVIDPIQAYLGSDLDLQIAGRARKLMRRLGMWAAGYDCAIVLIGHLNKKEGSIENQTLYYTKKIAETENWNLQDIYSDEGKSGTSLRKRDAFKRMMRDAKDQKMDLIICASISRFARNFSDCMTQIAALKTMHPAHPIGVYFETENIYTLNPSSQYSLDIQALLADWESGNKSRRMILSYDQRIMTGQYPVADLMGYRHTKDGQLVIEPEEAKTVRFIFLAFIQGYDYEQIAMILTQKKRSTLRGRQEWNGMMVANIMKNERRWGDLEARKSIVVDYKLGKVTKNNGNRCSAYVPEHHEAIVSPEIARAAHLVASSKKKCGVQDIVVIQQGALKGFVGIHPNWSGINAESIRSLCLNAYLPEEVVELNDMTEMRSGKKSDMALLSDYLTVSGTCFINQSSPVITISKNGIRFSKACHTRLDDCEHVELLYHPILQVVILRKSNRDASTAIHWENKDKICSSFSSRAFSGVIFEAMNWKWSCRYQCRGICRGEENARFLIFELDESRILIGKNQYEQIEGRSMDLKCRLYRSKWIQSIAASDVMKSGQVVENPMIGAIPSRNEVQRELDDLLMSM